MPLSQKKEPSYTSQRIEGNYSNLSFEKQKISQKSGDFCWTSTVLENLSKDRLFDLVKKDKIMKRSDFSTPVGETSKVHV